MLILDCFDDWNEYENEQKKKEKSKIEFGTSVSLSDKKREEINRFLSQWQ